MFNTQSVGKKISSLRKKHNMTQMELADRLGISFQSVSNWERGNSMPDISKLPEIAELFDVTIDEILGKKSKLIMSAADGTIEEYIGSNKITVDELAESAPILKPETVSEIVEKTNLIEENLRLSSPASEETEHESGEDNSDVNLDSIMALLPYMSEDAVDEIAERLCSDGRDFSTLLNYMTDDKIDEIGAKMFRDGKDTSKIINYMSEDAVDEIAERLCSDGRDFSKLLNYMSEDKIDEIADKMYSNGRDFIKFINYMSEDKIDEIGFKMFRDGKDTSKIINYMSEDKIDEIADMMCSSGRDITNQILNYMSEDKIDEIAYELYKSGGVEAMLKYVNYVSEDMIDKIAKEAIGKNNVKDVKSLAPYMD